MAARDLVELDDAFAAAVAVDRVRGIAGVARTAAAIGRALVDGVGGLVGEEELPRVDDVAAHVHLHVDVHRAPLVPARVHRLEEREPVRVRPLDPAHERPVVALDAGVDAKCIAVPDVDGGVLDRPARRGVDDRRAQRQR
jgi:hypothetical protein